MTAGETIAGTVEVESCSADQETDPWESITSELTDSTFKQRLEEIDVVDDESADAVAMELRRLLDRSL